MTWTAILGVLSAVGTGICALAGVAALKWYLWDIAIGEMGQPDRSMLFWGLPVAFLGIVALVVAALLGWATRRLLGRAKS